MSFTSKKSSLELQKLLDEIDSADKHISFDGFFFKIILSF